MAAELIDDRYRLEERIAVGGMAEVWAAVDVELERRVALKLLLGAADPERFAREARAAAGLSHPAICQLYDYGEAGGRPYIVLEYLPGGTLEERLATGEPLADGDAARIAREVASGLAHAHERGLVHRDIKPGNVLFDEEGAAKITDFGIARILSESTLTEAGTLLGTATYISPEQARGERATPASDVYSFGVILYRMLTGRLPFEAQSPLELAAMHESADPPPISSLRSDAPPALERVATAALAKRPEERPQDGSDLLHALEGEPETAVTAVLAPAGPADRLTAEPEGVSRRAPRALLFGGVLAALAAGGAAAALLTSNGDSEAPAKEPPPRTGSPGDGTRTTTGDTTRETTRETQPTQTRTAATSTEPAPTAPPEPTSALTTTATPPVTPTVPSVPEVTTAPPETPTTSPPVPTVTETSALPEPPPPPP